MKSQLSNTILQKLRQEYFLDPEGKNKKLASKFVTIALDSVLSHQGNTPIYPLNRGIPSISQIIKQAKVPQKLQKNPEKILGLLYSYIQGSVKSGNPYMVKNLIPTASLPALATYFAVSPYMANAVSGEDAAQTLLAEIACASAIARLAGLDPVNSAGVFTFGGTGTIFYAIKMGLYKAFPKHAYEGLKGNAVVIESKPAHYSHKTAAIWLGIGQDNSIQVSSHIDQTTDLIDLENKCRDILKTGKKIVYIDALGGTTSNLGIDNIKAIFSIREKLVKEFNLSYKPHIHVDSVLGWAYLVFLRYDFHKNPLGFSEKALGQIKKIVQKIRTIRYADSFGVDFHKTGFVAYNSSMIIVKNKQDLMNLQRDVDIMTPLFHDNEAYNPGKFTLETSRSAANILATWIALQTFGIEGYQVLLGNAIEMGIVFRETIEEAKDNGLYIANQIQYGHDVFVRCYPLGSDVAKEYKKELIDDTLLKKYTAYTSKFASYIFKNMANRDKGFAISKSSAAIYTKTGASMAALRIYPLSPYITPSTAKELIRRLITMKQEFDSQYSEHISK